MKRLMSLLLAGSLLLLPVASYYAISLKDIREKYAQFIKTDAAQKIMPAGILALGLAAGGLYYYWTSGGIAKPISFETEGYQVTQLPVYSQFWWYGGGAASCGYQTLLRAMQVVKSKSEGESDEFLQSILKDSASIQVYFGKNGEWRKEIIARRKIEKFKNTWLEKINSVFKVNEESIIDGYKSAFSWLRDDIAAKLQNAITINQLYPFGINDIQVYIKNGLEKQKQGSDKVFFWAALEENEEINRCIDFVRLQNNFFEKNGFVSLSKLLDDISKNPEFEYDFRGEWLDKDDMQFLWDYNREDIVSDEVLCYLNIIDDSTLIGDEYFDSTTPFIEKNIKSRLGRKEMFFAIFAVSTMENVRVQGGDITAAAKGHWYPLVMYQNAEGKREYYIMDSAGNRNRLNDTNAWKIINLIEQQVAIEPEIIIEQQEI